MNTPTRRNVHCFPEATAIRCGQLDEDWRTEGSCRQGHDPEIWYPHNAAEAWLGVAICHTCPVRTACLEYCMAHNERNGTWGGLTEWQRESHRRQLKRAAKAQR
jgi:WhiB family redox-sensing transcriptional regulator